jgi:predicted MFS family arabinose efflux permease
VGAALRVTFGGGAAVYALLAWAEPRAALAALAFVGGVAAAFRTVSIAPAVAQLSTEKNRARAFSLFFALAIGMGIAGGLLGGRLPEWLGSKQRALWAGCVISALALAPTLWLRFAVAERKPVVYPRTPFVRRYLAAAAVWNLFVGAFPPFFNTYFARRTAAGSREIGLVLSGSQVAQVTAILAAPALFARTGLTHGMAGTQIVAALLLVLLAPAWSMQAAALIYASYMSFQWMSEPGWHTLLMNGVAREQQSGASALNFFVIFSAQALAAAAFGAGVARWGYAVMLSATAAVGVLAAAAFRRLVR